MKRLLTAKKTARPDATAALTAADATRISRARRSGNLAKLKANLKKEMLEEAEAGSTCVILDWQYVLLNEDELAEFLASLVSRGFEVEETSSELIVKWHEQAKGDAP